MSKGTAAASDTAIQWSDINKYRFYSIGTVWYSAITVALHPVNVFKTRRQVLSGADLNLSHSNVLGGGSTATSTLRGMYRGIGIVLFLAIPARGIYISVLEYGRDYISDVLGRVMITSTGQGSADNQNLIASISGGIAGGLAGLSSQTITVPMDVISQRQMVMQNDLYHRKGDAMSIVRSIIQNDGVRGLYRGMGISLISSLPTGTLWWATYSGCQNFLQGKFQLGASTNFNSETFSGSSSSDQSMRNLATRCAIQLTCGLSAAVVAATLTQPLDVLRTRFQVSDGTSQMSRGMQGNTYTTIGKDLYKVHGIRGFFKGTGLRVMNLGLWGTILSSAYEYLRYVSRNGYESAISLEEYKMAKL